MTYIILEGVDNLQCIYFGAGAHNGHCCLFKTLTDNFSCQTGQIYIAGSFLSDSQTAALGAVGRERCLVQAPPGRDREQALAGGHSVSSRIRANKLE